MLSTPTNLKRKTIKERSGRMGADGADREVEYDPAPKSVEVSRGVDQDGQFTTLVKPSGGAIEI